MNAGRDFNGKVHIDRRRMAQTNEKNMKLSYVLIHI